MQTLIDVKNLYKEYGQGDSATPVLHEVSFQIAKGEFVAIMGPSGSGKSTLMHLLSFLDSPTKGEYFFAGADVSKLTDQELAKMRNKKVGFVFQAFHLLPRTDVYENVRLPLLYSEIAPKEQDRLTKNAIESVGLSHRIHYSSSQLSGGEKQRVAIARAIINDPDVIFADEPTGNLDSKSGTQILRILQDLNNIGRTIVMVTHEMDTALHTKRIIKIRDGNIESDTVNTNQRIAKDGGLQK
jgi:putative ABC transport system ATP-binding protein